MITQFEQSYFFHRSMYGEIIIGPPGSGKSTYALYKQKVLADRKIFTINLDPGNNKTNFDYDIRLIFDTNTYGQKNCMGPHNSAKLILEAFFDNYNSFLTIIENNNDKYFIFDFPGQLEFFMCNNKLRKFVQRLKKDGLLLVVVNLVDSVFFTTKHGTIMAHTFNTITMIMVELPFVNVISKGDNIKTHNIKVRDIIEGDVDKNTLHTFHKNVLQVVENEGLLSYEVMDYDRIETMMYLQFVIDKASGYLYDQEPQYEVIEKESIISFYE